MFVPGVFLVVDTRDHVRVEHIVTDINVDWEDRKLLPDQDGFGSVEKLGARPDIARGIGPAEKVIVSLIFPASAVVRVGAQEQVQEWIA